VIAFPAPDPLLRNVPPHSAEAERAVLGAVMLDQRVLDDVRPLLSVEAFYDPRLSVIYQAALDLRAKRAPVDTVTMYAALSDRGVLEDVAEQPRW